eukprot:CAMPEP_0206033638 /NCGR_PEP_ID=MMETSP1466-20131121/801_1 /ASSEMBLY_ACC=CAM_ASM_001126 /TAXON_ID=44452 /ORGANISM="Pavlova gyrans, Strain CCMP608" /LENGTH=256 /DNA_ID=CAMNT_0053407861 /DNA_START=353 /DNA_END=1123 /DNA_ORIENTATION=+
MSCALALVLCLPHATQGGLPCIRSQSQSQEEDFAITTFFGNRTNGTYVEIGGYNGFKFSNTLRLHTCLGWSGVLVEGNPRNFAALKDNVGKHRGWRRVQIYHGAVCTPPKQTVTFVARGSAVSGDLSQMSDAFRSRWHAHLKGTVQVACKPMSDYMAGFSHVDFFSLDIEGAEMEALLTLDMRAVTIDVFVVEFDNLDLSKEWRIRRLLGNLGYVECKDVLSRTGTFVHERCPDYIERCNTRGHAPGADSVPGRAL